jgi:hypothetical protein
MDMCKQGEFSVSVKQLPKQLSPMYDGMPSLAKQMCRDTSYKGTMLCSDGKEEGKGERG